MVVCTVHPCFERRGRLPASPPLPLFCPLRSIYILLIVSALLLAAGSRPCCTAFRSCRRVHVQRGYSRKEFAILTAQQTFSSSTMAAGGLDIVLLMIIAASFRLCGVLREEKSISAAAPYFPAPGTDCQRQQPATDNALRGDRSSSLLAASHPRSIQASSSQALLFSFCAAQPGYSSARGGGENESTPTPRRES